MKQVLASMVAIAGLAMVVLAGQGAVGAQGGDDPAQVAAGKVIFEANCAGCHSADGTGSDVGRPLTGIASQGDRETHIMSITEGKRGMPAWGDILSAQEIEQAASYVRLTFVAAEEPAEEPAAEAETTAETTAEAEADTELAVTGAGSTGLAIVGMAMLIGGLQLVVWSRREI